ncbi:DUF1858 domain-containing protein [Desulfosporosinus sp. SYSU MS00001]|uniref:DUF1858 domain-containing protein n=1 Tax=Desulfosporosinus sp. SYSU MS00001 TaxID=3416284 RepID=UPI003CE939BD
MGAVTIDLNRTLFDLTEQYPELIQIFLEIGLEGVIHPEMRRTGGKIMPVIEGLKQHGVALEDAVKTLTEKGFNVSY